MDEYDVAVTGLGFTGLATAVAAARAGFRVVGFDDSPDRVRDILDIRQGCGLTTVSEQELRIHLGSGMLHIPGTAYAAADVHVICVPTPPGSRAGAELAPLVDATDAVANRVRHGDLVLVQSTCPPGTIDRVVLPLLLERSGLAVGTELHVAHSPVRTSPGVRSDVSAPVPRIVAGASPACASAAVRFLRLLGEHVLPVSSIRTAELVKVFENTFRLVNISLVNELAELCRRLRVDVTEVLDAAATKPYGFLRHEPGPGAGGDCVPVSAGFFAATARMLGGTASVVESAIALNTAMPAVVIRRIARLLARRGMRPIARSRILVVGVTYKPDVPDVRRSAAVRTLELIRSVTDVRYHDPYVPRLRLGDGTILHSTAVDACHTDLVLVLTGHAAVDLDSLVHRGTVIDCTSGDPRLVTAGVADAC